jgi:hypothetical protein
MSLSSDNSKAASDEFSSEIRSMDQIEQPADWSRLRKWSIVVSATLITFMVSFASSVYSAVSRTIAAEFEVSSQVSILGVVLYVAAFALGPMIWGPASELYDSQDTSVIYHDWITANAFEIQIWSDASAVPGLCDIFDLADSLLCGDEH